MKISTSTRVLEITDQGVFGVHCAIDAPQRKERFGMPDYESLAADEGTLFPADTVAYAVGYAPKTEEVLSLREADEFYMIGDCVMPKNIQQATSQGFFAARNLGRVY